MSKCHELPFLHESLYLAVKHGDFFMVSGRVLNHKISPCVTIVYGVTRQVLLLSLLQESLLLLCEK
jgi:hypothetical protein